MIISVATYYTILFLHFTFFLAKFSKQEPENLYALEVSAQIRYEKLVEIQRRMELGIDYGDIDLNSPIKLRKLEAEKLNL